MILNIQSNSKSLSYIKNYSILSTFIVSVENQNTKLKLKNNKKFLPNVQLHQVGTTYQNIMCKHIYNYMELETKLGKQCKLLPIAVVIGLKDLSY